MDENIEEQQSDYDCPSNDFLIARLPPLMQATNYISIDDNLGAEETSDDTSTFIVSIVSEDLTDEED